MIPFFYARQNSLLDSLGEVYYTNQQYDVALDYYKKTIGLGGTKK